MYLFNHSFSYILIIESQGPELSMRICKARPWSLLCDSFEKMTSSRKFFRDYQWSLLCDSSAHPKHGTLWSVVTNLLNPTFREHLKTPTEWTSLFWLTIVFYHQVMEHYFALSCNGLLCIELYNVHIRTSQYLVWNPSIKSYKNIPSPTSTPNSFSCRFRRFGFCYDYSTDDHKILRPY